MANPTTSPTCASKGAVVQITRLHGAGSRARQYSREFGLSRRDSHADGGRYSLQEGRRSAAEICRSWRREFPLRRPRLTERGWPWCVQFLASDRAKLRHRCQPSGRWRQRCDRRTVSVSVLFVVNGMAESSIAIFDRTGRKLEQHRETIYLQRASGAQPKSAGARARHRLDWRILGGKAGVPPLVLFSIGAVAAHGRQGRPGWWWMVSIGLGFVQSMTYAGKSPACSRTRPAAHRCTARSPGFRYSKLVAPVSVWCNWFAWSPVQAIGSGLAAGLHPQWTLCTRFGHQHLAVDAARSRRLEERLEPAELTRPSSWVRSSCWP